MIKSIGLAVSIAIASTAASAGEPKPAKKPQRETVYCFAIEGTGTRIAKSDCKTKAEWRRLGVEVESARQ